MRRPLPELTERFLMDDLGARDEYHVPGLNGGKL
jgi:hypothetical protein